MESKKVQIELGCGDKKREGFIGIDVVDLGQEYVLDFEKNKLPFEDSSVDYIYTNHVIEHISNPQLVMNEAWRVLKPEGKFEIKVPYGLWEGSSKPVHKQYITACWFDWFRRDDLEKRYGYKTWIIEKLEQIANAKGQIYEVYCVMKPKK